MHASPPALLALVFFFEVFGTSLLLLCVHKPPISSVIPCNSMLSLACNSMLSPADIQSTDMDLEVSPADIQSTDMDLEAMDRSFERGAGQWPGISADELLAVEGLLELGARRPFISWGCRQKRSKKARGDSNYEDNINGLVRKENSRSVKEGKARSPRTPLSWSATERASVSSPGDKSDSTSRAPQPLCARALCPKLKFKVGRERVQNTPSRRGPKKKTHAELKELVNGLLLEKEELEKEEQQLLKMYQELRTCNEQLKGQVALVLGEREESKLPGTPAVSSNSAQETETPALLKLSVRLVESECTENLLAAVPVAPVCDENLSVERSSHPHHPKSLEKSEAEDSSMPMEAHPGRFRLPDLNIPAEDCSDDSPNSFDDQVLLVNNKAAVAAEARKHRIELIRVKYSQSGKARVR
eukprot:Gb_06736 [translate_table: standard]